MGGTGERGEAELQQAVLRENLAVHAAEAPVYHRLHPQLFHWHAARRFRRELGGIVALLGGDGPLRVLELGCGTGCLTFRALEHPSVRLTGVDLSAEMLAQLEARLGPAERPRVRLVRAEAQAFLAAPPERYDLVMCSAFLHHLVDVGGTLRAAADALRPGGILYVAFEPLRQPIASRWRYRAHRAVRALDTALLALRLRAAGLERGDDTEHGLADYQTGFGGIAPEDLLAALEGRGSLVRCSRFAARAHGMLEFLAGSVVGSQNTFSLVFRTA